MFGTFVEVREAKPKKNKGEGQMATSIYQKIDQGSVGQVDVEDYAAFVRAELARL